MKLKRRIVFDLVFAVRFEILKRWKVKQDFMVIILQDCCNIFLLRRLKSKSWLFWIHYNYVLSIQNWLMDSVNSN